MTRPDGSLRAFVALSVPPRVKSSLETVVQQLAAQIPGGVRWAGSDGIHLTLKFLGNIDSAQADDVARAMERASLEVSPFSLLLSGLGAFPNESRPRVIWAGVQGGLESVAKLQAMIEAEVSGLGFPREKRAFTPHLTLGRVRDRATAVERSRLGAAVAAGCLGPTEPWLIESVRLVRSDLGPGGARYSDLASAPLGGGAGPR